MKYGRYKVVQELGKGAMGVVFKAHDPRIDRMVALKVLREDRVASEAFLKRFLKEAMAIGRLSHPNIVTVYDVGRDQGTVFIAMEFLEGKPLDEILKERRLEFSEIVDMGVQMADAVHYAHQKGIVHRDIKPSNIIVTHEGQLKITDFGIARIEEPNAPQLTQAGEILGTPYYMSPEQLMGKPVDGRSDIFSMGVMLYEMAAEKRPFTGKSLPSIFNAIAQQIPEPPGRLEQKVPARLSGIILKALEKDPEKRFATAKEIADDLRALDLRMPGTPGKQETKTREKSKAPLLAAIAVLLVLSGGGYLYYEKSRPAPAPVPVATPETRVSKPEGPGPAPAQDHGMAKPGLSSEKTFVPGIPVVEITETEKASSAIAEEKNPEEPPATLAILKVETEPEGARLFLDGKLIGATPLDVEVPLGKHELRLTKRDYYDWAAQIDLVEPGPTPLFVKLNSPVF